MCNAQQRPTHPRSCAYACKSPFDRGKASIEEKTNFPGVYSATWYLRREKLRVSSRDWKWIFPSASICFSIYFDRLLPVVREKILTPSVKCGRTSDETSAVVRSTVKRRKAESRRFFVHRDHDLD